MEEIVFFACLIVRGSCHSWTVLLSTTISQFVGTREVKMHKSKWKKRHPDANSDHGKPPNKEFGPMIGARTVLRDGIHGVDVMVPSVVTSARNAWITFCRILIQFVTKKEALNKEDKEDEVVIEPVVPKRSHRRVLLRETACAHMKTLTRKLFSDASDGGELLPCN